MYQKQLIKIEISAQDLHSSNKTPWISQKYVSSQRIFCMIKKKYKQITWVPRSSPISVVISENVRQNVERIFLNNSFDIKLWRRYVDDCFVIVKKDQIDQLSYLINSVKPNIKFTCEKEQNSQLTFLIMRQTNGSMRFSVHRKPTNSGKYWLWKLFSSLL